MSEYAWKWEKADFAGPGLLVTEKNLTVMGLVEAFESGRCNAYLVDFEGRYRWRTVQKHKSTFFRDTHGNWLIELSALAPVVTDLPAVQENLETIRSLAKSILSQGNDVAELPIVKSDGRIVQCIKAFKPYQELPDWHLFSNVPTAMPKEKIIISSLKNKLLAEFAEAWKGKLDIEILSESNWQQVFNNEMEGTVLLYEADIFPDCKKIEIHDLYLKCFRSIWATREKYEKVKLFFQPRAEIIPKLKCPSGEPEMSNFESAFLCGLLQEFRPRKILEVGLAAGGTSAIVMQCMHMLQAPYEMHSVDLCREFYRDNTRESGYLAEEAKKFITNVNQHRHLGHLAFHQMPKIGGGIDFLILDTEHILPGEMLDFLSLLPFLSENAIVVMHDLRLNWRDKIRTDYSDGAYVNKLILATVTAQRKFMQYDSDVSDVHGAPNIGAFQICKGTRENIADMFNALSITWNHFPPEWEIPAYRQLFSLYYDEQCLWLYDVAVKINCDIANCQRK